MGPSEGSRPPQDTSLSWGIFRETTSVARLVLFFLRGLGLRPGLGSGGGIQDLEIFALALANVDISSSPTFNPFFCPGLCLHIGPRMRTANLLHRAVLNLYAEPFGRSPLAVPNQIAPTAVIVGRGYSFPKSVLGPSCACKGIDSTRLTPHLHIYHPESTPVPPPPQFNWFAIYARNHRELNKVYEWADRVKCMMARLNI